MNMWQKIAGIVTTISIGSSVRNAAKLWKSRNIFREQRLRKILPGTVRSATGSFAPPLGLDWIIDRILDPDSNMFASGYYMQIVEQYGEYIYNTVR